MCSARCEPTAPEHIACPGVLLPAHTSSCRVSPACTTTRLQGAPCLHKDAAPT